MSDTTDIFSVQEGDLIALKVDPNSTEEQVIKRLSDLRNALDKLGYQRVGILVISSNDDIKLLRESDMRKLGWMRIRK